MDNTEQHRFFTFQGHQIHYRDEGMQYTQVVVLLHGFMQNRRVWDDLTLQLMKKMRVISVDLPGHGKSESFCDVYTMELMARVVKTLLESIGVGKCVIMGHSMGGYVALKFAEMFPQNVVGIGLLHSHSLEDSEEKKKERQTICDILATSSVSSYVYNFVPSLFDNSNKQALHDEINDVTDYGLMTKTEDIIASQRGMMQRNSTVDVLLNAKVPVMFIYGKKDPRIPLEVAVTQAALPRYSEMHLLDNVAHMAHVERPHLVLRWIINFVNECYDLMPQR